MKKAFILFFMFFLVYYSVANAVNHDSRDHWKKLNEIADQALQYGKQEKFEETKNLLQRFSNVFLKQTSENSLSMQELKMIIVSYEQAEEAVTNVKLTHDERIKKLTQLRLVVDAVSSEHQPLWKDAKTLVITPFEQAVTSLHNNERDKFQYYLNEFFLNYDIIRPALIVDLVPEQFQKIDSYVRFLENERHSLTNNQANNERLLEIKREINKIFDETNRKSTSSDLIEVIYFIGGAIIFTLIYVGWRKYKGEKKDKKAKELDH